MRRREREGQREEQMIQKILASAGSDERGLYGSLDLEKTASIDIDN